MEASPNAALIDDLIKRRIEELLPQKLEEALAKRQETRTPAMSTNTFGSISFPITGQIVCFPMPVISGMSAWPELANSDSWRVS